MSDKQITVLGYGPQGRAWGLNLKDSGCRITVGLPPKSPSRRMALKDGLKSVTATRRAVRNADIVIFAFPDHLHREIYKKDIMPNLKPGAALVFLHGLSIHFELIEPPEDTDVILLAPLGPGNAVRESYLEGNSIGYFYCIHQNGTGSADTVLNSLVRDLKIDQPRLIKTSFRDEAVGDLFGEQAVLCGGLSQLLLAGFETLRSAGLSPEKAYLEVAYQIDLIVDLIKKYGIEGMYKRISVAARFGSYEGGPKIINRAVRAKMKERLKEIENGKFAKRLNGLKKADIDKLNRNIAKLTSPELEKAARKFSTVRKPKKDT